MLQSNDPHQDLGWIGECDLGALLLVLDSEKDSDGIE